MTPSERVRERIRAALDRDGWTQREFAGKIGKSQPWLVKILAGENNVRLDDLDEIARVLNVPVAELIRDTDNLVVEVRPTELQLLRAFRGFPFTMQGHWLTVLVSAVKNQAAGSAKNSSARKENPLAQTAEVVDTPAVGDGGRRPEVLTAEEIGWLARIGGEIQLFATRLLELHPHTQRPRRPSGTSPDESGTR